VRSSTLLSMRTCFAVVLLMLAHAGAGAQTAPQAPTSGSDFLAPFPPHHVIGNIYFVGSKSLGIYLVTTPQGHILINAGLEDSVPMIQQSVEKLGFRFNDIKILLISHAHYDHDAGAPRIKKLTGAKYMVMDADVPVVESGGEKDFFYSHTPGMRYPAKSRSRLARWRHREPGRHCAHGLPHARPYQRLYHMDDEGERSRQKLRCGHTGQH